MTRNHENGFDSSDGSDESEYCAYSTINPKWLRNYESGNFGVDFPIEKADEPKSVNLSKEALNNILKIVRNKQNAQQPTESKAAQSAITAIIGSNGNSENANVTQETTPSNCIRSNGGVGQMPPEQPANQRNVSTFFFRISTIDGFIDVE